MGGSPVVSVVESNEAYLGTTSPSEGSQVAIWGKATMATMAPSRQIQ
jgi:hypothetical protein